MTPDKGMLERLLSPIADVRRGEAAAALIHAHEAVLRGEGVDPWLPDRAIPLVLQVSQPVRRLDHRQPLPGPGVGNAGAVEALAEADVLECPGRFRRHARWL